MEHVQRATTAFAATLPPGAANAVGIIVAAAVADRIVHAVLRRRGVSDEVAQATKDATVDAAVMTAGEAAAKVLAATADTLAPDKTTGKPEGKPGAAVNAAAEDAKLVIQEKSVALRRHARRAPAVQGVLTRPLSFLVWASAGAAVLRLFVAPGAAQLVAAAWQLSAIGSTSWAVALYGSMALQQRSQAHPEHAHVHALLRTLLVRGSLVGATLACLPVLQLPGLLRAAAAVTGVGGVMSAIAMQKVGADMVGGLGLSVNGLVSAGDHISISGYEGVVTDIGLLNTTLLTEDGQRIVLSNSTLGAGGVSLRNRTRGADAFTCITADFPGSAPKAKALAAAAAKLEAMLSAHPGVLAQAAEGALRTCVMLGEPLGGGMAITMRAFLNTEGKPPGEVEALRRELLVKAAAIVYGLEEAEEAEGEGEGEPAEHVALQKAS